uniref:Uncharacterized protein n=1 Tax=Pithovirus LCDPAC01 TaxID=2506600 RepID=A0A481YM45_9VIRU|nr:MAG: protein of unknown function DUF1848 [Pithovirus LCDPAC01]
MFKRGRKKCVLDVEDLAKEKKMSHYEIISCSRRTDIPAGYLRKYLKAFEQGWIDVPNPRNGHVYRISLTPFSPDNPKGVKVVSWWSKDYGKWIKVYKRKKKFFSAMARSFV